MYVCTCNPFSDKTVKTAFDQAAAKSERVTLSQIYRQCSSGQEINGNCHACAPMLADMVRDHNRKIIPVIPVNDPL